MSFATHAKFKRIWKICYGSPLGIYDSEFGDEGSPTRK